MLWANVVVSTSIFWFAFALSIPALLMHEDVPLDALSATSLSLHVVTGAVCASKYTLGCVLHTCTQYVLAYITTSAPLTARIRENYTFLSMFWCMAILTSILALLLTSVMALRFLRRQRTPDVSAGPAGQPPTGIPVIPEANIVDEHL